MWPLKSICTRRPQIYSPTTQASATGGQPCARETCGTEHWGALIARSLGSRACVCGHPKRKPVPAPPVLIFDVEVLHFFFPQDCSVVCCWISPAQDSRMFSQPRLTESQAAPQCKQTNTDGEPGLASSSKLTQKVLLFWDNSQSFVSQSVAE